nr:hypothetical protein [Vibrio splendidus]MCC4883010.1 hypothetical protein [Vibrio splendidus]
MKTIVIKQEENGTFSIAATNGEAIRVILLEEDLNDEANITINGVSYFSTETVVSQDLELVAQVTGE